MTTSIHDRRRLVARRRHVSGALRDTGRSVLGGALAVVVVRIAFAAAGSLGIFGAPPPSSLRTWIADTTVWVIAAILGGLISRFRSTLAGGITAISASVRL